MAFVDTKGAATGSVGSVFELETTDEADSICDCPLWLSEAEGSAFPAEVRERAIVWKATKDPGLELQERHATLTLTACLGRRAAN